MPNVSIKITNLPQIRRAFGMAPSLMRENFHKALTKSAILVQSQSMIRTPVRTGRLRSSHRFDVTGAGIGLRAEVGPTAHYGIYVHEGTRFMRGRPFLRQGAEASLYQIQDFFKDATQSALDSIARRV